VKFVDSDDEDDNLEIIDPTEGEKYDWLYYNEFNKALAEKQKKSDGDNEEASKVIHKFYIEKTSLER
jgi:hypothetical protein